MIGLDKEFYKSFFKYYGDELSINVPMIVLSYIPTKCKSDCMDLAFNTAKTSATLGSSYGDYYTEAAKRLSWEVAKDLDKFIFSIAFAQLCASNPKELEEFLGVRLFKRDVYSEVAKEAGTTVEKIKTLKAPFIPFSERESRDKWFYDMCMTVASYSHCFSRRVGAVLVRDNGVISTGYNGPPRGVPPCDQRWHIDDVFKEKYGHHLDKIEQDSERECCPRKIIGFPSGQGLEVCVAGHGERNALINAARLGIATKGTKMYMSCGVSCTPCLVEIINAGVEEIICSAMTFYDESGMYLLENSDLKVRIFDFLV